MSRITPFLYLGDASNSMDNVFLKKHKITLIVNCAKELPNYFPNEFEYVRLNWDDYPEQNISPTITKVSQKIISEIKNKNVVFVHCAAGISRSATVVIYVIMHLHNWNLEKSMNYVKILREIIHPNPGFVHQLKNIMNTHSHHNNIQNNRSQPKERLLPHQEFQNNERNEHIERSENREEYSLVDTELRGEFPDGSLYSQEINNQKVDNGGVEPSINKSGWSSLTFDSDQNEQPEFIKNKKRMYARIL